MNREPNPRAAAERLDPGTIHYLHIGKTGGTAIKRLLANASHPAFELHPHSTGLEDLPRGARYFFSTRQPVTRFYSGFYSRKRRGRPTYDSPWSADEELAFGRFPQANDLAEALFEPGAIGREAVHAIGSIRHTARKQVSWFAAHGQPVGLPAPVWIVRQEHFSADLARFAARVGLRPDVEPEAERVHANDYSGSSPLSDKAKANLERWYAEDIAFYAQCEAWLAANS